ncbi:MAG TPA: peptide chain release factor N(5)-glutamine methyltransferase [Gemmatimonadales bacterium]|nr:peptide chain release factor N(5)-glutamine methyltransferase [Gemmatimonadales bacterium]
MPERAVRARPSSLGAALDEAVARLGRSGVTHPRREAMHLWAAVAGGGIKPGDVWLRRDQEVAPDVTGRFWEAVERRSSGIPFAYAVGRVGFRTLELQIDPRALIPRPETEGLVELVLDRTRRVRRARGNVQRGDGGGGVVADIGTGCGCLALSLAVEGAFDRVIAVERSAVAAALARQNVELVRPSVRVEVREGDLLAPLAGERLRAIVANPPYLTEAEYEALDPAVRLYEPREALVSGADGLAATRALLGGGRGLLAPGEGLIALEIDERRADETRALAREQGWSSVVVHEDLFGRPRFLLANS